MNYCISTNISEIGGCNEVKFWRADAELGRMMEHPDVLHMKGTDDIWGLRRIHSCGKQIVNVDCRGENAGKRNW